MIFVISWFDFVQSIRLGVLHFIYESSIRQVSQDVSLFLQQLFNLEVVTESIPSTLNREVRQTHQNYKKGDVTKKLSISKNLEVLVMEVKPSRWDDVNQETKHGEIGIDIRHKQSHENQTQLQNVVENKVVQQLLIFVVSRRIQHQMCDFMHRIDDLHGIVKVNGKPIQLSDISVLHYLVLLLHNLLWVENIIIMVAL